MMSRDSLDDDPDWDMLPDSPSKVGRIHSLAKKTKEKTKKLLDLDQNSTGHVLSPAEAARKDLEENPAFNPSRSIQEPRATVFSVVDKTVDILQGTARAIVHPQKAIQSGITKTAAGKLAKGRPQISKQADLDFLDAYDDLQTAQSSVCASDDGEAIAKRASAIDDCNGLVADLEEKRMSMRVAWITDRHMRRVKVIRGRPGHFPEDSFFEQKEDCGETEFRWGKWIAFVLLYYSHPFTVRYIDDFDNLSFDLDTLRRHVERFIIVSAPLQTFCYRIRRIYRWESPVVTGQWMALYFFLWYFSQIMTFARSVLMCKIYVVINNYYYPISLEELRESMSRTIDRGNTAFKVAELMDKHGNDDWLEPLIEKVSNICFGIVSIFSLFHQLGPWIQMQISDTVNILEVIENFYQWKSPQKTQATLFLFFVCALISGVASSEFCLKIIYFISGMTFFICWPISSHFPNYRLLVSPFKWIFWDIPTHAEWSISYLQLHSDSAKTALESRNYARTTSPTVEGKLSNSTTASDSDESFSTGESAVSSTPLLFQVFSFRCTHAHTPGRLIITSLGLRFQPSLRIPLSSSQPAAAFHYPWTQLAEMNKPHHKKTFASSVTKITTGLEKLELRILESKEGESGKEGKQMGVDGAEGMERETLLGEPEKSRVIVLEHMRNRDKVFNAIIGFSGLRWQSLQGG